MQPEIRYTRSADGADIAFWRLGSGPVLVQTPLVPFSHIELEWQVPDLEAWYRRLGREMTLVRYDARGTGLSQRAVDDVSLSAHSADLEAVLEAVGGGPATVMGVFHAGPASIDLAVRRPDIVERLVLWCTYASGRDYWKAVQAEGLRALRETDYALFLRTAAHELFGWDVGPKAEAYADVMRAAADDDMADRLISATRDFDVDAMLGDVRCPALVVHRRDLQWIDVGMSRSLAARIPDARLAVVEGRSPLPGTGDVESALGPIDEFLGRRRDTARDGATGQVQTILFTDVVDHTAMMAALGDSAGREVLRAHDSIVRDAIGRSGGREVKALGDGFMATFGSVVSGVEAAIAIQRAIAEWNTADASPERPLQVRVGLNAGEPIQESGDLFGQAVILASRISALAGAGEILVGNTVKELAAGKQFAFSDRGEFVPKGFDAPLRVWAVEWTHR
jgi:class 3 adenylate cyclase